MLPNAFESERLGLGTLIGTVEFYGIYDPSEHLLTGVRGRATDLFAQTLFA